MQAHGPEYGVFHGDIARQQAEAEGKRRLRQVLVHKAEQQRRAENGKALAIGLQAAQHGPAEQQFFRDRGGHRGIERERYGRLRRAGHDLAFGAEKFHGRGEQALQQTGRALQCQQAEDPEQDLARARPS